MNSCPENKHLPPYDASFDITTLQDRFVANVGYTPINVEGYDGFGGFASPEMASSPPVVQAEVGSGNGNNGNGAQDDDWNSCVQWRLRLAIFLGAVLVAALISVVMLSKLGPGPILPPPSPAGHKSARQKVFNINTTDTLAEANEEFGFDQGGGKDEDGTGSSINTNQSVPKTPNVDSTMMTAPRHPIDPTPQARHSTPHLSQTANISTRATLANETTVLTLPSISTTSLGVSPSRTTTATISVLRKNDDSTSTQDTPLSTSRVEASTTVSTRTKSNLLTVAIGSTTAHQVRTETEPVTTSAFPTTTSAFEKATSLATSTSISLEPTAAEMLPNTPEVQTASPMPISTTLPPTISSSTAPDCYAHRQCPFTYYCDISSRCLPCSQCRDTHAVRFGCPLKCKAATATRRITPKQTTTATTTTTTTTTTTATTTTTTPITATYPLLSSYSTSPLTCNAHRQCTLLEYCGIDLYCHRCINCRDDIAIRVGCPLKCNAAMRQNASQLTTTTATLAQTSSASIVSSTPFSSANGDEDAVPTSLIATSKLDTTTTTRIPSITTKSILPKVPSRSPVVNTLTTATTPTTPTTPTTTTTTTTTTYTIPTTAATTTTTATNATTTTSLLSMVCPPTGQSIWNLSSRNLRARDAITIANQIDKASCSVRYLNVSNNPLLLDDGVLYLRDIISKLDAVDFSDTGLGASAAYILALSLSGPGTVLSDLDLSHNAMDDSGIHALVLAAKSSGRLGSLSLRGCQLTDKSALLLGSALASGALKKLDVRDIGTFTEDGRQQLHEAAATSGAILLL